MSPRAGSPRDTQRLRGGSEPLARRPLPFEVPRCSIPHQGSCPQHRGHGGAFLCFEGGMNRTGVRITQAEARSATATRLGGTPREPACPKRIHGLLVSQHDWKPPALLEAGHPQARVAAADWPPEPLQGRRTSARSSLAACPAVEEGNAGPVPISLSRWKNARLGLLWEERSLQAKNKWFWLRPM